MKRSHFLKLALTAPLAMSCTYKVRELEKITDKFEKTKRWPVLFIGHGHPMNALFDNNFTQFLHQQGAKMEKPNAIMVISAHWETSGTYVSVNPQPKTIYDFGGFDDKLFQIKYEPKGSPELAREVINQLPIVQEDAQMGLDHGAWTVLHHMFPKADIPVFQLSIDYTKGTQHHYELAQSLKKMRERGVLIIGSGNIVHNLSRLDWYNIDGKTEDWALEFDSKVKTAIESGNFNSLVNYRTLGTAANIAVPSEDHYMPMIFSLGLTDPSEPVNWLFEGFQYGNIGMRCFQIG